MGSRQDTMEKAFDVSLKNILLCDMVFCVLLPSRPPAPSLMSCMSNPWPSHVIKYSHHQQSSFQLSPLPQWNQNSRQNVLTMQNKSADQDNRIWLKGMEETSLLNFLQSKAKVRGPSAREGGGRKVVFIGLAASSNRTGLRQEGLPASWEAEKDGLKRMAGINEPRMKASSPSPNVWEKKMMWLCLQEL